MANTHAQLQDYYNYTKTGKAVLKACVYSLHSHLIL
jgi:hypothetical protein